MLNVKARVSALISGYHTKGRLGIELTGICDTRRAWDNLCSGGRLRVCGSLCCLTESGGCSVLQGVLCADTNYVDCTVVKVRSCVGTYYEGGTLL